MSERKQKSREQVPASLRELFLDDLSTIQKKSESATHGEVSIFGGDALGLERESDFGDGLISWKCSLVRCALDYFCRLIHLADSNPDWVIDDPPVWAYKIVLELLREDLYPEGALPARGTRSSRIGDLAPDELLDLRRATDLDIGGRLTAANALTSALHDSFQKEQQQERRRSSAPQPQ